MTPPPDATRIVSGPAVPNTVRRVGAALLMVVSSSELPSDSGVLPGANVWTEKSSAVVEVLPWTTIRSVLNTVALPVGPGQGFSGPPTSAMTMDEPERSMASRALPLPSKTSTRAGSEWASTCTSTLHSRSPAWPRSRRR
jgi:hypothetical protein